MNFRESIFTKNIKLNNKFKIQVNKKRFLNLLDKTSCSK